MIRVRGLALLLMLLPERRASDTSPLQKRLAPRFAERCSLQPASLLALRGGLGSVPGLGVRVQQVRKPVPTKDPPIFGTTELLDAVTGGQHSRTVARFNYAMENEGRAPTVEELQEGVVGAKHDRGSHLERLKRRAFDEVPGQATTGRDAAVVDSDFDDEDDEDGGDEGSEYYKAERTAEARRRRKQIKAYEKRYKQLDRGGHVLQGGWGAEGAAVPDEDSDMQDNIYLWRPEGVEESAVQDAAFEALQGDWGAGLAKLEDEVRAAPNNTEALNYLATALLSQPTPDTTRAAELLERAVECEPGNLALVGNLASVLAEAHGFTSPVAPEVAALPVMTRVEQLFQQVLSAHKTHVPTLSNYAIFQSNVRGDHVGAERLLLRAINADRCNIASLGTYVQLLIDHFPERRYVEPASEDLMGASYNLTGLGLARALTLKALRMDATHVWVQKHAALILSPDHPCQVDYLAQYDGARPSAWVHLPGHGMVPPDYEPPTDVDGITEGGGGGGTIDLFLDFDAA